MRRLRNVAGGETEFVLEFETKEFFASASRSADPISRQDHRVEGHTSARPVRQHGRGHSYGARAIWYRTLSDQARGRPSSFPGTPGDPAQLEFCLSVPKTITCNPPRSGVPRSVQLVEYGGVVPLTVRSDSRAEAKLQALIDTGARYTAIDESLAQQLQLIPLRQENIGTVSQPALLTIYRAELEIPPLGIRKWGEVLGGRLTGGTREALLGREELSECRLEYDGPSGNVTLTK